MCSWQRLARGWPGLPDHGAGLSVSSRNPCRAAEVKSEAKQGFQVWDLGMELAVASAAFDLRHEIFRSMQSAHRITSWSWGAKLCHEPSGLRRATQSLVVSF